MSKLILQILFFCMFLIHTQTTRAVELHKNRFIQILQNQMFFEQIIPKYLSYGREFFAGDIYTTKLESLNNYWKFDKICTADIDDTILESTNFVINKRGNSNIDSASEIIFRDMLNYLGVSEMSGIENLDFLVVVNTGYSEIADNLAYKSIPSTLNSAECRIAKDEKFLVLSSVSFIKIKIVIFKKFGKPIKSDNSSVVISDCEQGLCIDTKDYVPIGINSNSFDD